MEKSKILNLRVNPDVKERAEEVLAQLGIPVSTTIDIYLKQISLMVEYPFLQHCRKYLLDLIQT